MVSQHFLRTSSLFVISTLWRRLVWMELAANMPLGGTKSRQCDVYSVCRGSYSWALIHPHVTGAAKLRLFELSVKLYIRFFISIEKCSNIVK